MSSVLASLVYPQYITVNREKVKGDKNQKFSVSFISLSIWQKVIVISIVALAIIALLVGIVLVSGVPNVHLAASMALLGGGMGLTLFLPLALLIRHCLFVHKINKLIETNLLNIDTMVLNPENRVIVNPPKAGSPTGFEVKVDGEEILGCYQERKGALGFINFYKNSDAFLSHNPWVISQS